MFQTAMEQVSRQCRQALSFTLAGLASSLVQTHQAVTPTFYTFFKRLLDGVCSASFGWGQVSPLFLQHLMSNSFRNARSSGSHSPPYMLTMTHFRSKQMFGSIPLPKGPLCVVCMFSHVVVAVMSLRCTVLCIMTNKAFSHRASPALFSRYGSEVGPEATRG